MDLDSIDKVAELEISVENPDLCQRWVIRSRPSESEMAVHLIDRRDTAEPMGDEFIDCCGLRNIFVTTGSRHMVPQIHWRSSVIHENFDKTVELPFQGMPFR